MGFPPASREDSIFKAILNAGCFILMLLSLGCNAESEYQPVNGDIIFHTSRSSQSQAIQLATNSKYSHMGIVFIREDQAVVFEAVAPVKATPLKEWIARGENGQYVVKRLSNASKVLTPQALERMKVVGESYAGKNYDLYFEWSDDRIYCSELVWKIYYQGLGVRIGELQELSDFDLSSPTVRKKIDERWNGNPPQDEKVISPVAMFDSKVLVEVYRGGDS